ncbi:DUF6265 family protein [Stenotrophomonas acidaminiphila]|uniref:DUF6265 family protein n=1 Tax=Stenotrophomonas acidaminiphila TaxID=128780 RepID=UPI0015FDFE2A|nr:DUF6265 family protein [Stenotrophomonas acidaminiphila]
MAKAAMVLGVGMALAGGTAVAGEFDWLAGQWCGGSAERKIEEAWLPEAGGALLGMSRTLRGGGTESFEFMRLVPAGSDAGFHVQPNGAAPTVFAIAGRGDGWVMFANPGHDFPQRIEYRRDGTRLRAAISGTGADGTPLEIRFDYRRCAD